MTYKQSKGINKNYWPYNVGYALQMTSQTLSWLPKRVHYGDLPSRRRSTSLHLEPALTASTVFKQAKLTFHLIAF